MNIEFGNRIKLAQEKRGWANKRFAKALGCSERAIDYWRAGQRMPDVDTIGEIARRLKTSSAFLLGPARARAWPAPKIARTRTG